MELIDRLNTGLAGRYVIERHIGTGGMATVFLANDVRHTRPVAIKVLSPDLGATLGAERFLSEIRVTANLQHPGLLSLFDSGECDGLLYYVMPYVDGESLRAMLSREQHLPVDEVVRLIVALCAGLDYAHRHGVIHRDLKPENVLLHDGQPVIADFGIALAISNAGGARMTQTGISLGTPQYMAPEQAAGDRSVDARTDVYALGTLAYEMLAGEPPHNGATAQGVIGKLMSEEPRPVASLRRSVPAHVATAIHRALAKLPADRFQSASAFSTALTQPTPVAAAGSHRRLSVSNPLISAALGVAVAIAGVAVWGATHPQVTESVEPFRRLSLVLPDSAALDPTTTLGRSLAYSPDGKHLAYVGSGGVFIRSMNSLEPRRVAAGSGEDLRFSPDNAWLAYVAYGGLWKVPIGGGAPRKIADTVGKFDWGRNGWIVFTRFARPEIFRVSDAGGTPELIVKQQRPDDAVYTAPAFLADADAFLVTVLSGKDRRPELAAYRMSDGESLRYLNVRGEYPLHMPGVVVFADVDRSIMAAPFDTRTLRVTGEPKRVLQGVSWKPSGMDYTVARDGALAYLPGTSINALVEVDRNGDARPLGAEPRPYQTPRYSPDGKRIAVALGLRGASQVWTYDIAQNTLTQLSGDQNAVSPEWSWNGERVTWSDASEAGGELSGSRVVWRKADRSDEPVLLVDSTIGLAFARSRSVAVGIRFGREGLAMGAVQFTTANAPAFRAILPAFRPPMGRPSPDGRWIAYVHARGGTRSVSVRAADGSGGEYTIASGDASEPMWNPRFSATGGELFYRSGTRLIAATLAVGTDVRVVGRKVMPFEVGIVPIGAVWATYDVSPDGNRFLLTVSQVRSDQPIIVTGWANEVRDSLGVERR